MKLLNKIKKISVLTVFVFVLFCVICSQTVSGSTSDTETFITTSNSSTYIHSGSTAGQHTNETTMLVETDDITYTAFINFPSNTVALGAIDTAKFRVYYSGSTVPDGTFKLSAVSANWTAGTITTSNAPSSYLLSTSTANSNGYVDFVITESIVSIAIGQYTSYGLSVSYEDGVSVQTVSLYSANYTDETKRPQIVVEGKLFAVGEIYDSTYVSINNNSNYKFLIPNDDQTNVTTAALNVQSSDTDLYDWEIVNPNASGYSILYYHDYPYMALCYEDGVFSLETNEELDDAPSKFLWNIFQYDTDKYVLRHAATGKILSVSGDTPIMSQSFTEQNTKLWNVGYNYCTAINDVSIDVFAGTFIPYSSFSDFIVLNGGHSLPTNYDNISIYTMHTNSTSLISIVSGGIAIKSQAGIATITLGRRDTTATGTITLNIEQLSDSYFMKNMGSGYLPQNTGTNYIMQYAFDGTTSQQWIIEPQGDGYSMIKNASSGKYLQVVNNSSSNNAALTLATKDATATGQLFKIIYWGNDVYRIVAKCGEANGYVIGVQGTVVGDTSYPYGSFLGQGGSIDVPSTLGDWHFIPAGYKDVSLVAAATDHDHADSFEVILEHLENTDMTTIYENSDVDIAGVTREELMYHIAHSKITVVTSHGSRVGVQADGGGMEYWYMLEKGEDYFEYSQLVIYGACGTGEGGENAVNLVTKTVEAGVDTAIGFEVTIYSNGRKAWLEEFFKQYAIWADEPQITIQEIVDCTDIEMRMQHSDVYNFTLEDGSNHTLGEFIVVGSQTVPT